MTLTRFLKKDLNDFRWHWIFLVTVTALAFATVRYFAGINGLHYLLIPLIEIYALFGYVATMHIFAGIPRQHSCLSRSYLLSLPIKRKELFILQHARSLIFLVPLIVIGGLYPFMSVEPLSRGIVAMYFPALIVSIGVITESAISMAMAAERKSRYIPQGERVSAGGSTVLFIAGAYFLIIAWARLMSPPATLQMAASLRPQKFDVLFVFLFPWHQLVFPAYTLLLFFWVPRNARKWCVAL